MINIINVERFIIENKIQGPITSPQFYFGNVATSYNPQGLFSEEFFGVEGSPERRNSISYIDLNCNVIHAVLFDIINKRIFRKMNDLISGNKTFEVNDAGFLEENEEGRFRGLSTLHKYIDEVRFVPGKDMEGDRNLIIDKFYEFINSNTFFVNKLLVISPEYRAPYVNPETGEIRVDELSKLYQKIIILSSQLLSVSGSLYDILSYRMQLMLRDLYEMVKVKVSKKNGMIRELMLGARTDYSARTVISPNPQLPIGYAGIPVRVAVEIFEPNMLYGFMNSSYSNHIPDEFHIAAKEFLANESLTA